MTWEGLLSVVARVESIGGRINECVSSLVLSALVVFPLGSACTEMVHHLHKADGYHQ
jgi:hypothetical protein